MQKEYISDFLSSFEYPNIFRTPRFPHFYWLLLGSFFLNKAQGSVMSLEKEIVPKGDYHSSLEVIIENSYATSTGKLVVYLEGGHFNRQFGADEFALNTLSDAVAFGKKLSVNIKKISNSFTVFW